MMLANLGGLYSAGKSELQALINDLFGAGQQGLLFVPQPVVLNEQRLYKLDDFTDPVTADGDPVGGGKEVSGNGSHLTQSVSADRPTYNTDGTLHWLGFDGAGDWIRHDTGVQASQPFTHFIAFRLRSSRLQNIFNGAGPSTSRQFLIDDGGELAVFAGTSLAVQPADTDVHVLTVVFDGTNSYVRVDGVQKASGDTGSNPWQGATLAASNAGSDPGDVQIYGYIVTEGSCSADTIDKVESYLADRAGITL